MADGDPDGPAPFVLDVFRKRLVADWEPSVTYGYDPTLPYDDDAYLSIHTGAYDDTMGFPQVAISTVSSGGANGSPLHGFNAGGEGVVTSSRSFIDINCWAGTTEHVGADPDPDEIADAMGAHVRDILHDSHQWLIDPETGQRVAERIVPLGEPQTHPDPDVMTYWRSLVEVSYDRRHDP